MMLNESLNNIGSILLLIIITFACKSNTTGGVNSNGSESPVFNKNITAIFKNIILPSDSTTFKGISYKGRGNRTIFDRRVKGNVTINAYLFKVHFEGGVTFEVIANPEFANKDSALVTSKNYMIIFGKVPKVLRNNVKTFVINKGDYSLGGSNHNILIYKARADRQIKRGFFDASLVHEGTHASLDPFYKHTSGWINAQNADDTFLNDYARDNPRREDMASSYLAYLAVRYRPDRFPESDIKKVKEGIPHRISYFDHITKENNFDMHPFKDVFN